jgi:anion-transporting  ArsA/GET3 family ATPase
VSPARPLRTIDATGLLDRRLVIVAGKGGVGKTTVACALGLVAAQAGKRVLVVEVDGAGRAAVLLGVEAAPSGDTRPVRPGLAVMSVEGSAALAEYLQIVVPVKRVLKAVFESRIYQYFVAAAPGLKELMTVGKIWYEAERIDDGRRRWDLVIFDAPATGHSLQYLRMPLAARAAFGTGLVARESERLVELLRDPRSTAISLVTTAEEMPVNETVEMYRQVRDDLRMPLGPLFVNRLHHARFDAAAVDGLRQRATRMRETRDRRVVAEVVQRADEELGWSRINGAYLQRLHTDLGAALVEVPFLFAEEFGVQEVELVAATIASAVHRDARTGRRSEGHGRA